MASFKATGRTSRKYFIAVLLPSRLVHTSLKLQSIPNSRTSLRIFGFVGTIPWDPTPTGMWSYRDCARGSCRGDGWKLSGWQGRLNLTGRKSALTSRWGGVHQHLFSSRPWDPPALRNPPGLGQRLYRLSGRGVQPAGRLVLRTGPLALWADRQRQNPAGLGFSAQNPYKMPSSLAIFDPYFKKRFALST